MPILINNFGLKGSLSLITYQTIARCPGDWMLRCPVTAWIRLGRAVDMGETRILHIKSEVSAMIRYDTLATLKHPCTIIRM